MTGKDLFSKSSPILFGARLAPGPDMAARLLEARALGADFAGLEMGSAGSDGQLEEVFLACKSQGCEGQSCEGQGCEGQDNMGLCLFLDEAVHKTASWAALATLLARHAQGLPLLVASGDGALLREVEKLHPAIATGLVLPETCACRAMRDKGVGQGAQRAQKDAGAADAEDAGDAGDVGDVGEGTALCVLSKDLASGCRLCGLRTMGVYALVTGRFTSRDVVRMSLDGADAFLLDDMVDLAKVAAIGRRKDAG